MKVKTPARIKGGELYCKEEANIAMLSMVAEIDIEDDSLRNQPGS
jgi:hypothetical protein